MNPPYGSEVGKWIEKSYGKSLRGVAVILLFAARTNTSWRHEYVMNADEVRFIRGRIKFHDTENSAPFPSCIVVFGKRNWFETETVFSSYSL